MKMDEMPNLQTLTLEKLKIRGRMVMSAEAADEMTVEIVAEYMADSFVVNMSGFVWQNQIHRQTQTMDMYSSWWDDFKDTFFPEWLKRRMPVRTYSIDHTVEFIHTCPHLPFKSRDDLRIHMEWMMPPVNQIGVWE